jgi:lysozyme
MAAIGTEVASQLTATAVAVNGGGEQPTAILLDTATPEPPVGGNATETPLPVFQATNTPIPGATFTALPPAGSTCPNPYTVQQGDWIYKIARNCNVAVSALIAANPGINPSVIKPGQLLNMPGAGATPVPGSPPQATCSGSRTVVTGDTLFRLSYGCGLTVEQLAAANGIVFPYTIYPGQVINYP